MDSIYVVNTHKNSQETFFFGYHQELSTFESDVHLAFASVNITILGFDKILMLTSKECTNCIMALIQTLQQSINDIGLKQ